MFGSHRTGILHDAAAREASPSASIPVVPLTNATFAAAHAATSAGNAWGCEKSIATLAPEAPSDARSLVTTTPHFPTPPSSPASRPVASAAIAQTSRNPDASASLTTARPMRPLAPTTASGTSAGPVTRCAGPGLLWPRRPSRSRGPSCASSLRSWRAGHARSRSRVGGFRALRSRLWPAPGSPR